MRTRTIIRTALMALLGLAYVSPALANKTDTVWITVVDSQMRLLPRASVGYEIAGGGAAKATPVSPAKFVIKNANSKLALQVSQPGQRLTRLEADLPTNQSEVHVTVYLEGKGARLEVSYRGDNADPILAKRQTLFAAPSEATPPLRASIRQPNVQQGPGTCGAGGDCCTATTGTPGCADVACCTAVCNCDSFCCDVEWDIFCATTGFQGNGCGAELLCGGLCAGGFPACGTGGDCCVANPGVPGCADATCCDSVCSADSFCCDVEWDAVCAASAADLCPACAGPPCDVICAPNKTAENEPDCGIPTDTVNGGCNSVPPVFSPIDCGQSYCSTSAFDGSTRDTDWYRVVLPTDMQITWTASAEFDLLFGIVNNFGIDDCAGVTSFLTFTNVGPCEDGTVTACLTAGTWYLFVAPQFTGIVPCGAQYNASLTCEVCGTGGCCLGNGTCLPDLTSASCAAQGGTYQGDGSVCSPNPCPQPPPNDDCGTALPIAIGGTATGSTVVANSDTAPSCNGFSVTAPGVWYTVVGDGTTLTASLCNPGTNYDTKLHVYCPDCGTLGCAGGDDDACGFPPGFSAVTWCSALGTTYQILVSGFGGSTGDFELTVSSDLTPCSTPPSCTGVCGPGQGDCCAAHANAGCEDPTCCAAVCAIDPFCCDTQWDSICAGEAESLCPACAPPPCDVICDPSKTLENEPDCGLPADTVNGGCNSIPPVFSSIACGESYCSTGAFDGASRDTDWYKVVLATETSLTWCASAEFDLLIGIVNNFGIDDCAGVTSFLTFATAGPCVNTCVTACLAPGTWYLFVAPDFTDIETCGAEYNATLSCAACGSGACCLPGAAGTCIPNLTAPACAAQGGTYQDDGSTCTAGLCPMTGANDLCTGAIAVAVPSTTAGTTVNSTIDGGFPSPCGVGDGITTGGVWYSVLGTGTNMTASLCNGATSYDAKLTVYCPSCAAPTCVAGIDDFCGLQPEVSWCSQLGATYLILVHGFGAATGPFELVMSSSGGPCNPTVLCAAVTPTGACCVAGVCSIQTAANCAAAGGSYLGDGTSCDVPGIVYSAQPNLAIPDNLPAGVSHVMNISDSATITDLNVDLIIPHSWVGDLFITLNHGATTVTLVDRPGVPASTFGCANDNYDIILDDEGAGGPIETLCSVSMVSPPNYVPQNPLSAFDGQNISGAWTITVADQVGSDVGTLVEWSLHLPGAGTVCEFTGACCIFPNCVQLTEADCLTQGGSYLGDNTPCQNPGQTTVYSAAPGIAIPDNNPVGINHVINVPDATTIADLDVDLNIPHSWVGDLVVTVNHNATTVTIVDRPGVPASTFGCANDNYDIVLDDEGSGGPIEALCSVSMVSPPNFVPQNPLSAFDGMSAAGAWTITVSDNVGSDVGTLAEWSLHVTGQGTEACVFTGACCNTNTGVCTNNVLQANCIGTWFEGQTCDEINPPCQVCGNGIIEGTEQCDGGACCDPDCTFAAGGQVCRPSAGSCDVAESCTGSSSVCPPDGFAPSSQVCNPSAGPCDPAENCTGSSAACPPNVFAPSSQVCNASAGVCDVAENCTGNSAACPANGFAPSSQVCRASADVCDVAENCTGSSAACPGDGFAPSSQVCRGQAGPCDVAENCTGSSAPCPADGYSTGNECRPVQGICDVAEACDGSGADCPIDGYASGNECRASTGDCDPAEACDGSGTACPADVTITACIDGDNCCPIGCNGLNDDDCTSIPTVSEWGLIVLALLFLTAAKVRFGRREGVAV
ncbi:MAG: IPTL-CTERM sorting domain-containing protein [Planctomycetota bacterium]